MSRGETVLMVEDEPAIRRMTWTMLERLGYRVLAAGTPRQAIELCLHFIQKPFSMNDLGAKIRMVLDGG
jgi:DNA-binding response OmpR family regulator